MQQTGLAEAGKKRPSFSTGNAEGGGHVDISLQVHPTMDISDKTGAKVDTLFLPAPLFTFITRTHKEVVAYTTNNGEGPAQWGNTMK